MHSLGDPSYETLCLEDHLVCVTILDEVPIHSTANSKSMRVWGKKGKLGEL